MIVQANILITNANPVTACLADFEFATIMCDPSLGVELSESIADGGATPFMAPELLFPSKFGLEKYTPTKEADIYAMGMVIYQVRTARCPVCTRINSYLVGPHWDATVRRIFWVRGSFRGLGRRKTLKTVECTRTWSL